MHESHHCLCVHLSRDGVPRISGQFVAVIVGASPATSMASKGQTVNLYDIVQCSGTGDIADIIYVTPVNKLKAVTFNPHAVARSNSLVVVDLRI